MARPCCVLALLLVSLAVGAACAPAEALKTSDSGISCALVVDVSGSLDGFEAAWPEVIRAVRGPFIRSRCTDLRLYSFAEEGGAWFEEAHVGVPMTPVPAGPSVSLEVMAIPAAAEALTRKQARVAREQDQLVGEAVDAALARIAKLGIVLATRRPTKTSDVAGAVRRAIGLATEFRAVVVVSDFADKQLDRRLQGLTNATTRRFVGALVVPATSHEARLAGLPTNESDQFAAVAAVLGARVPQVAVAPFYGDFQDELSEQRAIEVQR